jgi:tetratricopeptide (TPR) repeat protein
MKMLRICYLCAAMALVLLCHRNASADVSQANFALREGRIDDAARLLQGNLALNPHDSPAHQLLCRVYYAQEMADSAIRECLAAVANDPTSSEARLWLGRSYGMKAVHANPISAFALARKVATEFERAVELDPSNLAAISDLGEFYIDAPGIVGGGLDKADRLAQRTMAISPAKAHRLLGLIAEKREDISTAEAEFKKAVEAQRLPTSLVDLGDFYQRHQRYEDALRTLQNAIRLDRARDSSLVDVASVLLEAHGSAQLAQQLLEQYLASPAKSDSAPVVKVHVQLGDLLAKSGDKIRARQEYESALALASNYAPAERGLKNL